jgi:hypothetical protein
MPMDCHATAPPVEISMTVETSGTGQAELHWTFKPSSQNDPAISVKPNGNMDFSAKNQPIYVTITLSDPDSNRVFYQGNGINVLGFADSYQDDYASVKPVPASHHQFSSITVTNNGKTVSFCYANHHKPGEPGNPNHYKESRYTMYLGDVTQPSSYLPFWIDPKIVNR